MMATLPAPWLSVSAGRFLARVGVFSANSFSFAYQRQNNRPGLSKRQSGSTPIHQPDKTRPFTRVELQV